jgi:hypothetical protein
MVARRAGIYWPQASSFRTSVHEFVTRVAPEAVLRPSPATGHAAEMLDVSDPDVGYDAETFPYQPPQGG